MSRALLYRLLICIFILGFFLYASIDRENELIELKMDIPKKESELTQIREENTHLLYEISKLEHPHHLFSLLKTSEFSHLIYPSNSDLVVVQDE